jgi:PAS domain S-box-containing protein
MAPGTQLGELAALNRRIADLEAEVDRLCRSGVEQFRRLADDAPVMIWTTDGAAQCDYVNRALLAFRGRALDAELGRGWMDGLHPDDREWCTEAWFKAFTSREAFRMEVRLQSADGSYVWVEDAGKPQYRQGGVFAGFMGTLTDISERKRNLNPPDEEAVRMVFALTERERQVLVLIAEGKSTKEAAAHLGITYKTADSHRSRILEKLGVHETASMVRYAIRAGLIQA